MINFVFFKYNYLGIIQEYFQPKIIIKKIFSFGQENNVLIKKKRVYQTEKNGANKTYLSLAALKLIKDSVWFLNTFSFD